MPDADLDDDDLAERQKYEDWDQPYPDDFQTALAEFINLPDDYEDNDSRGRKRCNLARSRRRATIPIR